MISVFFLGFLCLFICLSVETGPHYVVSWTWGDKSLSLPPKSWPYRCVYHHAHSASNYNFLTSAFGLPLLASLVSSACLPPFLWKETWDRMKGGKRVKKRLFPEFSPSRMVLGWSYCHILIRRVCLLNCFSSWHFLFFRSMSSKKFPWVVP